MYDKQHQWNQELSSTAYTPTSHHQHADVKEIGSNNGGPMTPWSCSGPLERHVDLLAAASLTKPPFYDSEAAKTPPTIDRNDEDQACISAILGDLLFHS